MNTESKDRPHGFLLLRLVSLFLNFLTKIQGFFSHLDTFWVQWVGKIIRLSDIHVFLNCYNFWLYIKSVSDNVWACLLAVRKTVSHHDWWSEDNFLSLVIHTDPLCSSSLSSSSGLMSLILQQEMGKSHLLQRWDFTSEKRYLVNNLVFFLHLHYSYRSLPVVTKWTLLPWNNFGLAVAVSLLKHD